MPGYRGDKGTGLVEEQPNHLGEHAEEERLEYRV